MKYRNIFLSIVLGCSTSLCAQKASTPKETSGNPIFQGWYADPEGVVFNKEYWVYPTYSAPYDDQIFMDAFSSTDLVNWKKHPRVIEKKNISWLRRALWAPAVVQENGKYYLFFGANDIQNNNELGGIGVAVADKPEGPFKDALGKPLNAMHVASDFLARHGEMYDFTGELLGDKVNTVKFDNSKIKRFVPDFICTISMAEGLRQSVEYMLAHPETQTPDPEFDSWCDRIIDAQRIADEAFETSIK